MRQRMIVTTIFLFLIFISAITMANAKGSPKELYNRYQTIADNFSGEQHGPYLMNKDDVVGIQFSLAV